MVEEKLCEKHGKLESTNRINMDIRLHANACSLLLGPGQRVHCSCDSLGARLVCAFAQWAS